MQRLLYRALIGLFVYALTGSALAGEIDPPTEAIAYPATLAALENAVEETAQTSGPVHAETIAALGLLEERYRRTGAYTDAEAIFQRIVAAERRLLPEDRRSLAPLVAYLVTRSIKSKRSALRAVTAALKPAFGRDSATMLPVIAHLAAVQSARGRALALTALRGREGGKAAQGGGVLVAAATPSTQRDTEPATKSPERTGRVHAPSNEGGLYHIQFASLRNSSRHVHLDFLDSIQRAHGDLLGDHQMKILPVDFGPNRGVFHRMMAGPMTEARGRSLCRRLAERDQDCFLVQP